MTMKGRKRTMRKRGRRRRKTLPGRLGSLRGHYSSPGPQGLEAPRTQARAAPCPSSHPRTCDSSAGRMGHYSR